MHDGPGGTREQYEQVVSKLSDGKGLSSLEDWPVQGLLSHAAMPTEDGWRVVDVWESEEAFQQFGAVLVPVLEEVGFPGQPKVYQLEKFVN